MIYIGIDPGKQGAVAVIRRDEVVIEPVPLIGKKEYDIRAMHALLPSRYLDEECRAVIERVHAMPGQGRTSMLSIGYGSGIWHTLLTLSDIPFTVVSAVSWQKIMLAGVARDDRKAASILVAKRLFPTVDLRRTQNCRVDDHNFADALLVAEFCRRTHAGLLA